MLYKITSLDAAKDQLNWSIYLLLNDHALIPSLTLAGAAEEILSKLLPPERRSYELLKKNLGEEFPDNHVGRDLNRLKNAFKHWETDHEGKPIDSMEAELEIQVATMIFRAMLNLRRVDKSLPNGYKQFIAWCKSRDFHEIALASTPPEKTNAF